ncbi:MAG: TonB-dependent receptor [Acidobacteriaceae bacterium]|nr:TonB-dependent receptor [Acidobacteriaceae bacterium]
MSFHSTRLAQAQTSTGELSVTVLDATGASVPNATVTITGSETGNVLRTLASNDRGIANVPLIPPGNYNISVVAPGFKTTVRPHIPVAVGSVQDLRVTLETGSSTQEITVTGQAPLVEDKSVTLAQVITSRQLIDLPLNGRNYLTVANLTAGAIPSNGSRDQTFSAYGNTGLQNAFLLDGARNENYLRGLDNRTRDMVRPPLDALNEFTVQTSNYSAEFGAAAGGVVNAITKNGTNELHGSIYEFIRNDHLDATNFFAKTRPLLVQNQYGASLGGPLKKDRAWLFGAYEGSDNRNEVTITSNVPTTAQRAGIFGSTAIFDPSTTRPNPSGSGYIRTQFPGNTIPASQLNPIGLTIANSYPLPNALGSANLFTNNAAQRQNTRNGVVRGDVQISSKDSVFARYSRTNGLLNSSAALPAPTGNPIIRQTDSTSAGLGYTRTLSPTFINELRFTWTTITMAQDSNVARNEIIPGSLDPAVDSGTPTFNIANYAGYGVQASCCSNSPLRKSSGVWDWSDNLSKSLGAHLLKFGGESMLIRPSTFATSNGRSSLGFTGVFTQNPQSRSNSGNALADLLLGDANSLTTGTTAQAVERGWFAGGYFQDQWTVSSQLTVNLGVRYEYFAPYIETQNRMADLVLDSGSSLYGQYILAGDKRLPRSLIYGNGNNIAPRVGLAWRVPNAGDLVFRSSFGIFYAQDEGTGVTNRMTSNPPFYGYGAQTISSDQLNPSTGFILNSGVTIPRPSPINPASFVLLPSATAQLVSWPLHFKTPYVQQWNFSVQKALPWSMLAEINYVGNHGVQFLGLGEGNQPRVLAATTVNSRRPLRAFTDASVKQIGNWNMTYYNGLSARLEKRFTGGVSFLSTFTYGHAIDLQNPALDLCDNCGSGDTIQDNYNRAANRASSDNDVRLRFVLAGSFELPFGKGKRYLSNSSIGSLLLGGWRAVPIYQAQTGLPFTPALSYDAANAGTVTRPNAVCSGSLPRPTLQAWFDTSCFVAGPSYVFGNAGRNILRGPGTNNFDVSVQRDFRFPIEHATVLTFRAEAYNAVNHPQFAVPGATVGNISTYGVITATSTNNRQLQLAIHVQF